MVKKRQFTNADDLLKELVNNEDHLGQYISELYSPRDEVDGSYLNSLFGTLSDQGLLSVQFADNIAYHVFITAKGFSCVQQLDKRNWREAINMFVPLHGKYRNDLLEIMKLYPESSVIPHDSALAASIKVLKTRGYLSNFIAYLNGWGVTYTYDDLNYLAFEEEYNLMHEKTNMQVTIEGGNNQVNVANDNATIHASQNNGIDPNKLAELINALKEHSKDLSQEDKQSFDDSLEVIQSELASEKPKKSFINTAITALKAINGTVQFTAALVTLVQFIQTVT